MILSLPASALIESAPPVVTVSFLAVATTSQSCVPVVMLCAAVAAAVYLLPISGTTLRSVFSTPVPIVAVSPETLTPSRLASCLMSPEVIVLSSIVSPAVRIMLASEPLSAPVSTLPVLSPIQYVMESSSRYQYLLASWMPQYSSRKM